VLYFVKDGVCVLKDDLCFHPPRFCIWELYTPPCIAFLLLFTERFFFVFDCREVLDGFVNDIGCGAVPFFVLFCVAYFFRI
jgi:hypothetical protein